jgi:hypothetical protein
MQENGGYITKEEHTEAEAHVGPTIDPGEQPPVAGKAAPRGRLPRSRAN